MVYMSGHCCHLYSQFSHNNKVKLPYLAQLQATFVRNLQLSCLKQICLQCLMTLSQRTSDVLKVIYLVNKPLEIIVLCFKPYCPVPNQWASSKTQRYVLILYTCIRLNVIFYENKLNK